MSSETEKALSEMGIDFGSKPECTVESGVRLRHRSLNSQVQKPKHYVGEQGLEVETVLQNFIPRYENSYVGHRVASAVEYLLRAPLKNEKEDIAKAKENLEQILTYWGEQIE